MFILFCFILDMEENERKKKKNEVKNSKVNWKDNWV